MLVLAALRPPRGRCRREIVTAPSLGGAIGGFFFIVFSLCFFQVFWPQGGLKMDPQHGPKLDLVLGGVLERFWEGFWRPGCA